MGFFYKFSQIEQPRFPTEIPKFSKRLSSLHLLRRGVSQIASLKNSFDPETGSKLVANYLVGVGKVTGIPLPN